MPRFIPTYVGHTRCWKRSGGTDTVHPHIRGAYGSEFAWANTETGSSPHTWGIRRRTSTRTKPSRFIPTYVGHTRYKSIPVGRISVHPHIRGAYKDLEDVDEKTDGSSPHTWGIRPEWNSPGHRYPVHPHIRGAYGRIRTAGRRTAVHPHIRGAYKPCRWWRRNEDGSSPHTWGILPVDINGRKKWRFIPTYVGHTPESCWFAVKDSVHPHIRGAYTGPPQEKWLVSATSLMILHKKVILYKV